MHRTFSTPDTVSLFVELRAGDLVVRATETHETVVEVSGDDADRVLVDQHGEEIRVIAATGSVGFHSSPHLAVQVTLPSESRLSAKLGSAGTRVEGRLGETHLKGGSGDVTIEAVGGAAQLETGSGDVRVALVAAPLTVKCGSGDVTLHRLTAATEVSTGSGDVVVGSAEQAFTAKSGSGDVRVRDAREDVVVTTASGELVVDHLGRGRLTARAVSGDIRVGVPGGVPVWTDVSSTTGEVRSNLLGAGQPADGEDFVELRATTVSGDVHLEQL
jgi:DUF4097 and DUF4098 domain-containing protein YvlB